jgi:hypothetical protein
LTDPFGGGPISKPNSRSGQKFRNRMELFSGSGVNRHIRGTRVAPRTDV